MIDSAPSLKKKEREKKEDHFKYKSHKSAKWERSKASLARNKVIFHWLPLKTTEEQNIVWAQRGSMQGIFFFKGPLGIYKKDKQSN